MQNKITNYHRWAGWGMCLTLRCSTAEGKKNTFPRLKLCISMALFTSTSLKKIPPFVRAGWHTWWNVCHKCIQPCHTSGGCDWASVGGDRCCSGARKQTERQKNRGKREHPGVSASPGNRRDLWRGVGSRSRVVLPLRDTLSGSGGHVWPDDDWSIITDV